ncbi:MAG: hypothetical protein AAF771_14705 [Pseudomonadota bacterium]
MSSTDMPPFEAAAVRAALERAWSLETARQWTADNPASGQCNVTAAVICDLFGGEVLRTPLGGLWHYYNRIDGARHDLTDSQFVRPGALFSAPDAYADEPSSVGAAMDGIPEREYATLRANLVRELTA